MSIRPVLRVLTSVFVYDGSGGVDRFRLVSLIRFVFDFAPMALLLSVSINYAALD